MDGIRLERLAIEVPELDGWVDRFEAVLGPGVGRRSVCQATGTVHVAIHPAGIELLAKPGSEPRLRSFHLSSSDVAQTVQRARSAGWREIASFEVNGRPTLC
jgi:hypothetical protein